MSDCPKSWESLKNPPSLRNYSAAERSILKSATLPRESLTKGIAIDLVQLYAKAVGYENEKRITGCLVAAGLPYKHIGTEFYEEPMPLGLGSLLEWRLGSPDWHSTKLVIRPDIDDSQVLSVRIDPNTPFDWDVGLSDRDIRTGLYFAEMARGYLDMALGGEVNL